MDNSLILYSSNFLAHLWNGVLLFGLLLKRRKGCVGICRVLSRAGCSNVQRKTAGPFASAWGRVVAGAASATTWRRRTDRQRTGASCMLPFLRERKKNVIVLCSSPTTYTTLHLPWSCGPRDDDATGMETHDVMADGWLLLSSSGPAAVVTESRGTIHGHRTHPSQTDAERERGGEQRPAG